MYRLLLFLSIFALFRSKSFAQQTLKIKVLEEKSRIPLAGIAVQNLSSKQQTSTDTEGRFNIKAKLNDLLVLTGFAYENDTVLVTDLKVREILMLPKGELLKQVNITNQRIDTVNIGIPKGGTPDFHNQTVVYQRDERGFYKGGVAFRIWSSKSGEKKRASDAFKAYTEAVRLDIDKVFNPANLSKYLPLKQNELEGFKMNYIPSVKAYTAASFNLVVYIDSCYKQFIKLPPEKRVLAPLGGQ